MFASASNETYGFHGFGDLVKAISGASRGKHDNRLQQLQNAGMNETTGSEGGYLVPGPYAADLLGPIFTESGILSRMNTIPMTSKSLAVGGFGDELVG